MFVKRQNPLITKRKAQKADPKPVQGPGQLSVFSLVCIIFVGAVSTILGLGHVHQNFQVRDYEIETARLQGLIKVRTNDIKKVDARIATLTKYDDLLGAAKGPLGLVDPEPSVVSGLEVSTSRGLVYAEAEKKAAESLTRQRDDYSARAADEGSQLFDLN